MDEIIKLAKITVLRDVQLEALSKGYPYNSELTNMLKELEIKYTKGEQNTNI